MLDLYSRWVLHMEMLLKSTPEDAPRGNLNDYLNPFLNLIDNDLAVHITEKGTKAVRARDYHMNYDDRILTLLVNYADMNVADPAFEHLERGEIRIEEKREGEGIAVSAHMAIDLNQTNPAVPTYNVLLEDVPGIGRTKLDPFFNFAFRKLPSLEYALEDGKVRKFRMLTELNGFMAETLRRDLEHGTLSWIELTQIVPEGGEFDEEGLLKEERRTIVVDVQRKLTGQDAVEALNRVRGKARNQGYTNMRVTWNRDEGRQKSRNFGTAREDVGDVLTLGTTHTRYDEQRQQCEERVRDDVRERLTQILISQRG